MDIAVTSFDAADQAAALAAHQINVAAVRHDMPDVPAWSRHTFLTAVAHPLPGYLQEWAIARIDGEPAGYLWLELPVLDNPDNGSVDIFVHPAYRRRGVGRALHSYACRVAREQHRKRLMGMFIAGLPGGPERTGAGGGFADAVGASVVLREVRRRLDLGTVDEPALDRLLADAWRHAAGYSLVTWRDRVPEEHVADVAYLDGRMIGDAPMGGLEWEPEKMDADRVRAIEAAHLLRGRRTYHVGARHDATGRLVAWTMLSFSDEPAWHSWQQITIVDPAHRGHRLGTIVKIENLWRTRAAEPALRYIDTCNADTNDYMISINDLLGFRPMDVFLNWQQKL